MGEPGMVSIICAVMNRGPALRVSLTSWLLQPDVAEIVIVDWSSIVPLAPLVAVDRRIRIVRVDGEQRFHVAASVNLAADCARHPVLLKLDADYVLNPYYRFLASHPLPEQAFITGHWRQEGPFLSNRNGLILVRAADWHRVHGVNEQLQGYGWEDDDFYERLVRAGLRRWLLPPDPATAFHIPHGDDVRTMNYAEQDRHRSQQLNKARAASVPYDRRLLAWAVSPIAERVQLATRHVPG